MDLLLETVDGHSLKVSQTGLASGIGGVAWDCGLVLSRLLLVPNFAELLAARLRGERATDTDTATSTDVGTGDVDFKSMTALELGSGTGLVGMQLAMLGFKTVLTDLPSVMPQLAVNLAQNAHLLSDCSILADIYVWGQEPPVSHLPVNLLAISDCLYAFECVELLSQSLRDIFAACESQTPLVLHAYEDRNASIRTEFLDRVGDFLDWEDVRLADFMDCGDVPDDVSLMFMYKKG